MTTPTTHIRAGAAGDVLIVDDRVVVLVAVPWDQPALVPYRGRVWEETFVRGAFPGIERLTPGTIKVHLNHDGPIVGEVTRFDPDSALGLVAEVAVSHGPLGDQVLTDACQGRLSASIGFRTTLDDVIADQTTRTRTVVRALLDHIALTATPAYATARVLATRSAWRSTHDPVMVWASMRTDPIFCWARRRVGESHCRGRSGANEPTAPPWLEVMAASIGLCVNASKSLC